MNTLSCKAQPLFPCFIAGPSSCLSTCSPDCLPTYRAPLVQIKGAQMVARWNIISFHKNSFWKEEVQAFFALSVSKPPCLPSLQTVQPLSIILPDRLPSSLPVYLNISVTSVSLCNPPCLLTLEKLHLLNIFLMTFSQLISFSNVSPLSLFAFKC